MEITLCIILYVEVVLHRKSATILVTALREWYTNTHSVQCIVFIRFAFAWPFVLNDLSYEHWARHWREILLICILEYIIAHAQPESCDTSSQPASHWFPIQMPIHPIESSRKQVTLTDKSQAWVVWCPHSPASLCIVNSKRNIYQTLLGLRLGWWNKLLWPIYCPS